MTPFVVTSVVSVVLAAPLPVVVATSSIAVVASVIIILLIYCSVLLFDFFLDLSLSLGTALVLFLGFFPVAVLVSEHVLNQHFDSVGHFGLVWIVHVGLELVHHNLIPLSELLGVSSVDLELVTGLVHDVDTTFDQQVLDVVVGDAQKGLEHLEYHIVWQQSSSVELAYKVQVSEQLLVEKQLLLHAFLTLLLFFIIEEFFKADSALRDEQLSELGPLDVLHVQVDVEQLELKSDQLLANFSVKDGVLLLNLSLPEDVLHNDIQDVFSVLLIIESVDIDVPLFAFELLLGHHIWEHVLSQLLELLLLVLWGDDVHDETDLLFLVFGHLGSLHGRLGRLLELLLLLSVFLLPCAHVVVWVVVMAVVASSVVAVVVVAVLVVIGVLAVVVLVVVLLHVFLTLNNLSTHNFEV